MIRRSLCFPWNQSGTSTHLPGAGHVPSVQVFVLDPAASSFGCPGFLPRRTGMFQSLVPLLHSSQWLAPSGHGPVAPNDSVRFWHPSNRTCFQPKFSKTSGCEDQQHLPQASAHMYFAKHWLQDQLSRTWRSRKFYTKSQVLLMYKDF